MRGWRFTPLYERPDRATNAAGFQQCSAAVRTALGPGRSCPTADDRAAPQAAAARGRAQRAADARPRSATICRPSNEDAKPHAAPSAHAPTRVRVKAACRSRARRGDPGPRAGAKPAPMRPRAARRANSLKAPSPRHMDLDKSRYVVIEGPIGAARPVSRAPWRSTCCRSAWNAEDNHSRRRVYEDMARYALPAQ